MWAQESVTLIRGTLYPQKLQLLSNLHIADTDPVFEFLEYNFKPTHFNEAQMTSFSL
jgi:hypothetical protein